MRHMSTFSEPNDASEALQKSSTIIRIISKLVGDQPNLKINFDVLKFRLNKKTYTLNGEVNFNVIYSNFQSPKEQK
jgi:hypothetical protein